MKRAILEMQVLYEIAMQIGASLDLNEMLRISIKSYLRKLNCASAMVLRRVALGTQQHRFDPVLTIPRNAANTAVCQAALLRIPVHFDDDKLAAVLGSLPYIGELDERRYFYIMALGDFGLLILSKGETPLAPTTLLSLEHLNRKLAQACIACLHNEQIQQSNRRLQQEIRLRSDLENSLQMLLDELEQRVAKRTLQLQQSNHELSMALANVKRLSGLLPICAKCKKIRDDKGYWTQIETYIYEHSEADFSHGICPHCMDELYPELQLNK